MWGPGETGQSFYQRWQGHVRETRDGRRGVLDVEDACRSLKTVLWRGARTKDPTRRIEFAGRSDLREALERQFAKQCLFVCELPKRLAQRFEAVVIDDVINWRDRSRSLLPQPFCDMPDKGYLTRTPRRADEEPITVRNLGLPVHGIPAILTI